MDGRLKPVLEFIKHQGCMKVNRKGTTHLEFFWAHLEEQ